MTMSRSRRNPSWTDPVAAFDFTVWFLRDGHRACVAAPPLEEPASRNAYEALHLCQCGGWRWETQSVSNVRDKSNRRFPVAIRVNPKDPQLDAYLANGELNGQCLRCRRSSSC